MYVIISYIIINIYIIGIMTIELGTRTSVYI